MGELGYIDYCYCYCYWGCYCYCYCYSNCTLLLHYYITTDTLLLHYYITTDTLLLLIWEAIPHHKPLDPHSGTIGGLYCHCLLYCTDFRCPITGHWILILAQLEAVEAVETQRLTDSIYLIVQSPEPHSSSPSSAVHTSYIHYTTQHYTFSCYINEVISVVH